MTLLQLLYAALEELERPKDEATVSLWRERLVSYANEAVADLYTTFRPWRREALTPTGGVLNLSGLSVPCSKVLGLEYRGSRIPFLYGTDVGELIVPGWTSEPLTVVYRCAPRILKDDADRTGLPPAAEPLIVLYMTARERAHGDSAAQRGSQLRLALYESQKRRLKLDYDEPSGCRLCNYW